MDMDTDPGAIKSRENKKHGLRIGGSVENESPSLRLQINIWYFSDQKRKIFSTVAVPIFQTKFSHN